ncbi:MAG: hypothetical protein PHI28_06225 [Mangrovibacterium sp.]|nr:hypothetical protein [Mangrovibacterium sp.]
MYVHGYTNKEALRLNDQAATLDDIIHYDPVFPQNALILEAGCGVGAQTRIIATKNPDSNFISVNAIRTFIGEGMLVWGARTLDGNSSDWRHINVRRTVIMLEESIKTAGKAYVFEPNVANTWFTLKSVISGFLTGI